MRDIVFTCIMVVLLPASFLRPWVGILVWSWLAYMNLHQFCYGFANSLVPWSYIVAICTLAGFVFTRDRQPFVWCRESILMLLLWGWFAITTQFAWYPDDAWFLFKRFSKIILMTLLTISLIRDRGRMRWLLLVIAGSLGFYGVKGGLFVILTGGAYMVWGAPGETFISSNNALALALNMCLPLFWYLRKDEPRRWVRYALSAAFGLSVIAVPFTYSRGGVLGLCCVLGFLFVRSKYRYALLPLAAIGLMALVAYAPAKWVARMQTLETYDRDESAMGRLDAWNVGYKIANDSPILGAGFNVFNHFETYAKYAPELGRRSTDAHSIYFNLLGEHGYVGLGLFIGLVWCALGSVVSTYRAGRRYQELSWVADYSYMLGVCVVAYLVTGAFLSVSYFDLAWHFLALVVVLKELTRKELAALAPVRSGRRSSTVPSPRPGKARTIPAPAIGSTRQTARWATPQDLTHCWSHGD